MKRKWEILSDIKLTKLNLQANASIKKFECDVLIMPQILDIQKGY